MLAQMRKDLSPSATIEAIRELGWHLGSSRESGGASEDDHEPEPTQPSGGTGRIMKYLEDWRRIYEDGEERRRAAREAEMAPEERDRSPAARPRARSAQRGRKSGEGALHPGAGED